MEISKLSNVYDKLAEAYDRKRSLFNIDEIVNEFRADLDVDRGSLLDLGCGTGVPVGSLFVRNGWDVVGVDISQKMLSLAHDHVPEMKTVCSDICSIDFDASTFDAITLVYSLFHIPKNKHRELLGKLYRWLKPNGVALFTYATKEFTGRDEFEGYIDFLGQPLFYSHETPGKLYRLLENVGFQVVSGKNYSIADETFLWVTIRKPM